MNTKGSVQFRAYVEKNGPTAVAKALKVGRVTVWRWAHGLRTPSISDGAKLKTVTGIAIEAWDEEVPPDRKRRRARRSSVSARPA